VNFFGYTFFFQFEESKVVCRIMKSEKLFSDGIEWLHQESQPISSNKIEKQKLGAKYTIYLIKIDV